ncbi:hypothetical protein [Kitasatospora sp. NPDC088346]|uniref:hypothetical protein n=1 Tax=Kitasatospora sp. NPDC088346 TaxID=3364073 RepID=UPI0037F79B33
MNGPEHGGADFGLAGLEAAGVDDLANARILLASDLAFAQEHEHGLAASNFLGTGPHRVLAARITRDQQAGTYTVRLHRADDAWEALAWLRRAADLPATTARRSAALARSRRTAPAPLAAAPRSATDQPRTPVRRR